MNLLRFAPASIRCRIPAYKVRRWWSGFRSAAFDFFLVVGLSVLLAYVWYLWMFRFH